MSFAFKRLADYWNPQTNPVGCCVSSKTVLITKTLHFHARRVPWARFCSSSSSMNSSTAAVPQSDWVTHQWDVISMRQHFSSSLWFMRYRGAREWLMRHSTLSCSIRWQFERQTPARWQYFSLFYRKSRKFNNKAIFSRGVWRSCRRLKIEAKKNSWARFGWKSCLRVSRARGLRSFRGSDGRLIFLLA